MMPTLLEIWRYWWAVLLEACRIVVSGFGYGRPIQILTPVLLAVVGIARFVQSEGRSSQEVFDYWDGIVAGLQSVGIVATIIFLLALVSVPVRFAKRQDQINEDLRSRIERLEASGSTIAPKIHVHEIVVAWQSNTWFALAGTGIPGGFYLVARSVRLVNPSSARGVFTIRLRVSLSTGPLNLDAVEVPSIADGNSAQILTRGLLRLFTERRMPNPVNLDALSGETGTIFFRLHPPGNGENAAKELRRCLMEWEIEDSISGAAVRLPVQRSRAEWLYLSP
jgi:hypothetical protein